MQAPILPYDDAYITFRYVENFVAGKGLVYNVGQHVWGYSTVAYLFWLSGIKILVSGVALPELAVRANVIPFAACGFAVYLLVARITQSRWIGAIGAGSILVHPAMLCISTGGMESFLFLAFALFSLWSAIVNRHVTAGILAGMAILTRPEGVLLGPILLLARWREWKSLVKMAVPAGVLVAAWLLFARIYYGGIVPHSVIAKNLPLYPLAPGTCAYRIYASLENLIFGTTCPSLVQLRTLIALGAIAAAAAGILLHQPYRRNLGWALPAVLFGVVGLYHVGNPLFMEWYWPSVLVTALLTVIVGAFALATWIAERFHRRGLALQGTLIRDGVLAGLGGWLILSTVGAYGWNRPGVDASIWSIGRDPCRLRVVGYRHAAERLNRFIAPHDVVAAPEIGALGYYLEGRVLDVCGLVSPEAIAYLPTPASQRIDPGVGAVPLELVRSLQPQWVVSMPLFIARSLTPSEWFGQSYELAGRVNLPVPCFQSPDILVFRKKASNVADPTAPKPDADTSTAPPPLPPPDGVALDPSGFSLIPPPTPASDARTVTAKADTHLPEPVRIVTTLGRHGRADDSPDEVFR